MLHPKLFTHKRLQTVLTSHSRCPRFTFCFHTQSDWYDLALCFLMKSTSLTDKTMSCLNINTTRQKTRRSRVWIGLLEDSQLSVRETHDCSCGTKTGVEYIAFPRAWKTRPINKTVDLVKPAKAKENLNVTNSTLIIWIYSDLEIEMMFSSHLRLIRLSQVLETSKCIKKIQ